MSIQKALTIEIEREKNNTLRILNALPKDKFDYKPHPKSMTLGELANHVVELHNWVSMVFTTDVFDFHTDYKPSTLQTAEELIEVLEAGHLKNLNSLNTLSDETYLTNWALKAGEHVIVDLPKAGAFRFIVANHLIHHRGQLALYLRLLDVPVPGLYGPSADEQGK
ncbi:DinB family protein [Sphingobacterium bovistauri]|uniref:DinB family protein n=1 Tax=Sphingobacterium bovistauri TaxID=2781959 RepID=A0ABS7Z5B0_9SPHI|nr:DinB family protein [Sphingobacterium bovistauri]MCA5004757.1 DinB family protein [Sphingobacterium bovistauri]